MEHKIRVLLADDHPLVRAGIRATLAAEEDLVLVGEAADGNELRQLCHTCAPEVVLLDLNMPGPPGVQTVVYLREHLPQLKVLVLTAYDEDAYVRRLVGAGAVGYILKDEAPEVVVLAIRAVMRGDAWFSPAVAAKLLQPPGRALPVGGVDLTARERELLCRIAQGQDNARIGEALGLAEQTVRNYVSRLYATLGVESRAEAIVWARERGLVGK